MTQHLRAVITTPGLAALALCQACAGAPTYRVPVQLVSNRDLTVVSATAHRNPNGIVVGGDVRRSNGYAGALPGHLRVIGRDASGRVVATTDAPWGEFMSRRFRLAYFKAFLPTTGTAAITAISVEPVTQPPL